MLSQASLCCVDQRQCWSEHVLCVHVELQARAVAMLSRTAEACNDDVRLQRIVPYLLVSLLELPLPTFAHSQVE